MIYKKFNNRIIINANLITISPLYIGARTDSFKPGTINGSCLKDAFGRPFIPGSSLKGVLRAFLAGIDDYDCNQCNKEKTTADFRTKPQRENEVREAREKEGEKYKDLSDDEILYELITNASTTVEFLFGSNVMAGKIKISDALPVDDQINTDVRNGVAIDRDTRTALGGALYNTEVVPAGTFFNFLASADNLLPKEINIFGKLMDYFAEGNIIVGGRSRSGLGNIMLRDVEVIKYLITNEEFPTPKKEKCNKSIWEALINVQ